MKDGLDADAVEHLSTLLARVDPDFDASRFISLATADLDELELKARVIAVSGAMHKVFDSSYDDVLRRLVDLRAIWERNPHAPEALSGFVAWPIFDYVERFGLSSFDASLEALRTLTPIFSAEFAVRPYLIADQGRALAFLETCLEDEDEHVRRWVSEGTRPRLPWGARLRSLVANPEPALRLLEQLKDDPSEYVRRSVANHLNDVSKDHPDRVVAVCERWAIGASKERRRLIKHALRTLVKAGHPGVWSVLGFTASPAIDVIEFRVEPATLVLGEELVVRATLKSLSDVHQKIVMDIGLHLIRSRGETSRKVFKWAQIELPSGSRSSFEKTFKIQPVTTRNYYPGIHRVDLQLSGVVFATTEFELLV